ncbi:hypothetical protein NX801_20855 [Streptomyces sp. LP05-1]|uniref:DUF559 domain-containing protein n=1 Tax=Streptomyces pyxinae TaxID=2970734 RepID=A0ABT2CKW2_9ACTN|nr:hypothetical protein [Streptomyces sp. LP05-1]MCS0638061.1 hypothetical protein [Streptomyces sp. LP05-1]
MTNTPLSPGTPLPSGALLPAPLTGTGRRVLSAAQLRALGVPAAESAARARPGGPWQQFLPGVFLLHPGPPTSEERLRAVLLYAGRRPMGGAAAEPGRAMITGAAALTLHGFASAAPLPSLERIEVLVERKRRLRPAGCVRFVRTAELPEPVEVTGVPVAPVARALADVVAGTDDPTTVRLLLAEAVRDGHCDTAALVRELTRARLLGRAHVADAVDGLLAEGRSVAEERLYAMVGRYALPEPLWNVDLRLPGGPHLGGVDAYWPDHAVAVELDTRAPRRDEEPTAPEHTRKREHLERLGITLVHLTPRALREAPEQQAVVVRTALTAAGDGESAAYVIVLPR